jgi:hypothetical protein
MRTPSKGSLPKLRPAVVATVSAGLSLAACGSSPSASGEVQVAEAGTSGAATASSSAASVSPTSDKGPAPDGPSEPTPKVTRKRVRTTPSSAIKRGPTTNLSGPITLLNPKDSAGRTIQVGFNDSCYVEVPWQGERAKQPIAPGGRSVDFVPIDCPAALDDPAWDACVGSSLFSTPGRATCVCNAGWGNPPPPPFEAPCPK